MGWEFLRRFSKMQGVVMIFGVIVSTVVLVHVLSASGQQEVAELIRPDTQTASSVREITVVREDGQQIPLKVSISGKTLSEQEAEELFAQAIESLPDLIKGENASLEQVQCDLILPNMVEELGVQLIWQSNATGYISHTGRLVDDRQQDVPEQVTLSVTMTVQDYSRTREITLIVFPVAEPSWEERLADELSRLEAVSRDTEKMILPKAFEGEAVQFVQQEDYSKKMGQALLPAIISLLIFAETGQKEDKKKKRRQEEIAADYPELIVKMTVLYQAGLSMRGVWERIGADARKKGGKMRPIYEEVCFACNSMSDGVPEQEAYRQFGRRCCTVSCLKLGNLLAGNVRRGTKQLSILMAQESERAWELRKHQARRSGEKAGTKMLLPMFMMFGVVLTIVVIPAFYSFMI